MKINTICLLFLLLSAFYGCGKEDCQSRFQDRWSWASMAKGYDEEGALPIFGSSRHAHLSQGTADGQLYDFVLKVGPLSQWSEAKAKVPRFWGWGDPADESESLPSDRHVLQMSLSLNGKSVHIPEGAYIDLVDLRIDSYQRLLMKKGSRVILYLEGADAGECYRAKFTIKGDRIVKREIWAGEFPEFGPETVTFE